MINNSVENTGFVRSFGENLADRFMSRQTLYAYGASVVILLGGAWVSDGARATATQPYPEQRGEAAMAQNDYVVPGFNDTSAVNRDRREGKKEQEIANDMALVGGGIALLATSALLLGAGADTRRRNQ